MKITITLLAVCICIVQLSCSKDVTQQPQYRFAETMNIDGLQRTYTVQLPQHYYDSATDMSLVIGLHGTGGSGYQFETDYGFSQKANTAGFIAVYPDGVQKQDGLLKVRTWNAGSCCDYAMNNNINDVKFISALIDELSGRFHINRKKVYVAGMSNGAMLAYRLAAELPGKIAAIAAVSGTMVYEKNKALEGIVPVLHIHSALDTKVPFTGGIGIGGYNFPPVIEGLQYWAQRDGCNTTAAIQQNNGYELYTWKNAAGDTLLQCYLTADGGHAWPGSVVQRRMGDTPSAAFYANDVIWNFFSRFSLP